jgi:hypothetical protein
MEMDGMRTMLETFGKIPFDDIKGNLLLTLSRVFTRHLLSLKIQKGPNHCIAVDLLRPNNKKHILQN